MTLEGVVLVLLPLGHHQSYQRVTPKSHWETGWGKLLPSRETNFSVWVTFQQKAPLSCACASRKISLQISVHILGADATMGEEQIIHHGPICLKNQPCQNRWLLAKIQETPSGLARCLYIRYITLSERWDDVQNMMLEMDVEGTSQNIEASLIPKLIRVELSGNIL